MTPQQKIINLITLLLLSLTLYYLSSSLAQHHQKQQQFIHLTRAIGRGDTLTEPMIKAVEVIAKAPLTDLNDNNPTCFIKAFYQIVVKKAIDAGNLFNIFEESNQEFDKVTSCSHYLSLLIFRAQTLQSSQKDKIMKELLELQKSWIQQIYPKPGRNSQICIYFNAYNIESTVKQQVLTIANQNYENFKVTIQDDASTDNTPMFIKYTLEELKKENINFLKKTERLGIIGGLKEAISECSDNSIVVVLSEDQNLLGANALYIIDRIFSNTQVDLTFLASLTTPHSNLQNINFQQDITSSYMPFLAFRKKYALELDSQTEISKELERNWLGYLIQKQSKRKDGKVKVVNEGVVYRKAQKSFSVLLKLEEMRSNVNV